MKPLLTASLVSNLFLAALLYCFATGKIERHAYAALSESAIVDHHGEYMRDGHTYKKVYSPPVKPVVLCRR